MAERGGRRKGQLQNTKNLRKKLEKHVIEKTIWGRFWCNGKLIIVNGSCGLIRKVTANFHKRVDIFYCQLRLCLVVSMCLLYVLPSDFHHVSFFVFDLCCLLCVMTRIADWNAQLPVVLAPVSGSNIPNIEKWKNQKSASTCLVAIAVHLRFFFDLHGSQIPHVATFSWRKHPKEMIWCPYLSRWFCLKMG